MTTSPNNFRRALCLFTLLALSSSISTRTVYAQSEHHSISEATDTVDDMIDETWQNLQDTLAPRLREIQDSIYELLEQKDRLLNRFNRERRWINRVMRQTVPGQTSENVDPYREQRERDIDAAYEAHLRSEREDALRRRDPQGYWNRQEEARRQEYIDGFSAFGVDTTRDNVSTDQPPLEEQLVDLNSIPEASHPAQDDRQRHQTTTIIMDENAAPGGPVSQTEGPTREQFRQSIEQSMRELDAATQYHRQNPLQLAPSSRDRPAMQSPQSNFRHDDDAPTGDRSGQQHSTVVRGRNNSQTYYDAQPSRSNRQPSYRRDPGYSMRLYRQTQNAINSATRQRHYAPSGSRPTQQQPVRQHRAYSIDGSSRIISGTQRPSSATVTRGEARTTSIEYVDNDNASGQRGPVTATRSTSLTQSPQIPSGSRRAPGTRSRTANVLLPW